MKDVAQEVLDIMNAPVDLAGELAKEIFVVIRDNPGVSAGLIVGYTQGRVAGKSHNETLLNLGIGFAAGKALEEIIKWVGRKV
jgi:hypothetical protein